MDRSLWSLDPSVIHLNHGSYGAVPHPVLAEAARWREELECNPDEFLTRRLPALLDAMRVDTAAWLGATADQIAFVPNVTYAMACVLASTPLRRGDEVVVTSDTYPAVIFAARFACIRSGARLVVAELPTDDLGSASIQAAVLACLTPRTRLAIIDHVTSPTAIAIDVAPLTRILQEAGVRVAVDGAHAVGLLDLDLDAIGADFYAGNFHKWCCAPRGAGFLAVARDRQSELIPGIAGSRADEGFPAGLEWWGTADYAPLLSVPAALHLFETLGWEQVRRASADLATSGAELVGSVLGVQPSGDGHSRLPMRVLPLPTSLSADRRTAAALQREIAERLRVEVAVTAARGRLYLRLSAHLYNDMNDFAALTERLPVLVQGLSSSPTDRGVSFTSRVQD